MTDEIQEHLEDKIKPNDELIEYAKSLYPEIMMWVFITNMEDKLDPEKLNREFRNLTSNVEKNQKEIIDYRWRIAFRTAQSETEENSNVEHEELNLEESNDSIRSYFSDKKGDILEQMHDPHEIKSSVTVSKRKRTINLWLYDLD